MEENRNNQPFISVIMPVYNGELYLQEAIESIISQTYGNYEFIIINDGSTDDSELIILSYSDPRIKYVRNERNIGLIGSLNKGIGCAKGKYIARMDQDDISLPTRFELQVQFLETHSDVVICGMQGQILQTGKPYRVPVRDSEIRGLLFFGSPFIHPVVMIRNDTLAINQLRYDVKYNHAEDFGLWMNISFMGKLANLNEVGIYYRRHELQYTKVFKKGNSEASFSAKLEYLKRLGINLEKSNLKLYQQIFMKEIENTDNRQLFAVSKFFEQFRKLPFPKTIEIEYLEKYLYKKWKIICADGMKRGINTYFTFLSNKLVYKYFEPKVHLWFLKKLVSR